MADYLYIIDDLVFENKSGKHNAKSNAVHYCKKHGIDPNNLVRVSNDFELAYYRLLKDRVDTGEIKDLMTHRCYTLEQAFVNYNSDYLNDLTITIPFSYRDSHNQKHLEVVVSSLKDLSTQLLYVKTLVDKDGLRNGYYLKLLYPTEEGTFKEFKLNEIDDIRSLFREHIHQDTLAKLKRVREREKYERLFRLRNEGKITDNQRKELYRLEEKYERG